MWTKERPTEEGLYWYARPTGDVFPVIVRESFYEIGKMEARFPDWARYELMSELWRGQWYGPLLPPELSTPHPASASLEPPASTEDAL